MIENRSLHCIFILFTALFLHASLASLGHAEITLDGTVGPCYPLSGPDFMIPAEAGRQVGGNLFHSFGLFNVNTGESATFTGPDSVENILGRVTGGSSSTINGLLRSEIPGADLFLINPAGIMFGANAQLDVQGSFHVSTADFVSLGEHGRFDAVEPDTSVLTVAPPSAFGFLGENPASISVQGSTLNIPERETLSIVGGDILIEGGFLSAMGGKINLASVASAGELNIENITHNVFEKLGNINLTKSSNLLTTGLRGGDIYICSNRFVVDNSNLLSNTLGEGEGGDIAINVGSLSLSNEAYIDLTCWGTGNGGTIMIAAGETISISGKSGVSFSAYNNSGSGGSFLITTPNLSLDDGWIAGDTLSEGHGGYFAIAVESLSLSNGAYVYLPAWNTGNSGTVALDANDAITVSGNSSISVSTYGSGAGGSLSITTSNLTLNDSWITGHTLSEGNGGCITIDVESLNLINGAYIGSPADNIGDSGTIALNANDAITVSGNSLISVSTYACGAGGSLSITTPDLTLDDSWITGETLNEGNGGYITIDVGSLSLTNGASIGSECWGTGNGGAITLTASDVITVSGNSLISASTVGKGNGGNIQLQAKKIVLDNGSAISAESYSTDLNISENSEVAKSGNIVIQFDDILQINNGSRITVQTKEANAGDIKINEKVKEGFLVHLRDKGAITTAVAGGKGNGGNILIDPVFVVLDGASEIVANAIKGGGGDIDIHIVGDGAFLKSPDSIVDASSNFGVDGSVRIDAPDTDISGSISTLPASFLDASSLLSERCVTRTAGELSTFNIVGHGGMPLCPDTLWPAFYLLDNPKDQQKNPELNNR